VGKQLEKEHRERRKKENQKSPVEQVAAADKKKRGGLQLWGVRSGRRFSSPATQAVGKKGETKSRENE